MKEYTVGEYKRCKRLLTDDPFNELPHRPGGYTFQYWQARALESGDPLALTDDALRTVALARVGNKPSPETLAKAHDQLTRATRSSEPDVLLKMGLDLLMSADHPERHAHGAAWMLAACRAGADCGTDSRIVPTWMCPDCPAGTDAEAFVRLGLPPQTFADAYARSQQIEQVLRSHDAPGLASWLESFWAVATTP